MHRNPVKRGLVESPELWRWSSFRAYFTQRSRSGRGECLAGAEDEDSAASRVRAKTSAGGGTAGPLLKKREKWRTPSLSYLGQKTGGVYPHGLEWLSRSGAPGGSPEITWATRR